jgi:hypothetical protein
LLDYIFGYFGHGQIGHGKMQMNTVLHIYQSSSSQSSSVDSSSPSSSSQNIPFSPHFIKNHNNFIAEVFVHYGWSESYSFCCEGHRILFQVPMKLLADFSKPKQAPDQ